ncbi:hypothetical protein [Hymenobacter persicinus]|uniref:Uncharacterized protein n=1 Tax=Hymenobacter persicinus TaxID=2025506 RepID=A0A4Q5LAF3_9BACT|nr:hypothetical protein [Hymenobacter persicinus]RYU78900.1 hypothetical protein EWM57_12000 [Hymenobacter persicinus]
MVKIKKEKPKPGIITYAIDGPKPSAAYYIAKNTALNQTIDAICEKALHDMHDTIKYAAVLPDRGDYITGLFADSCLAEYLKCIPINSMINPQIYFKVKDSRKYDNHHLIGFAEVRVIWLHLKMDDWTAVRNFNYPYTLSNAKVVSRWYDIYLPLRVESIDNNVSITSSRRLISKSR